MRGTRPAKEVPKRDGKRHAKQNQKEKKERDFKTQSLFNIRHKIPMEIRGQIPMNDPKSLKPRAQEHR